MTRILRVFISVFLGGCLFLTVNCSHKTEHAESEEREAPEISDVTEEALLWADSIFNKMSPEERVAQLLMPAVFTSTDISTMGLIKRYAEEWKVGGLLLLKGDAVSAAEIADTLEAVRDRTPHAPGMFISIDAETGLGMRFSDAPVFPWLNDISHEADENAFYDYGCEIGREARIAGINMILGPVLDVDRPEQKEAVMRKRSLGSDQLRVAELSVAYTRGLESFGIACVAKHFPGHGSSSVDTHKNLATINTSRDELYGIDMLPFRKAIQNGLSCIMVGHIWAPALDSIKRPASFSPIVIKEILRNEMKFNGLVIVDALGMGGAKGFSSADAIAAGADIILAPVNTEKEISEISSALEDGRISQERIKESCMRILFYKYLHSTHSSHRTTPGLTPAYSIKERLTKEAPHIISRLKGISQQ